MDLPITTSTEKYGTQMNLVELPAWAADLAVKACGGLLVPAHCIEDGNKEQWQRTDWLRAVFELLTCLSERLHEEKNGPIHSYSSRLPEGSSLAFDYAWVNRIALFLRRWAAQQFDIIETDVFNEKPRGKIYLSHDVDYISKTFPLRVKQGLFSLFNFFRAIIRADVGSSKLWAIKFYQFVFRPGGYWQFPTIRSLEKKYGITSTWNIYGGRGGRKRALSKQLLDPSYDVQYTRLKKELKSLLANGHIIGLHQAFHSWDDSALMTLEKNCVESATESTISTCRQHWLRFSFSGTWKAQEQAGFKLDTTLGFNDRIAFRNSAALKIPVWISNSGGASKSLHTLPMVLMDSHLFDYKAMHSRERRHEIDKMINEVAFTGGEASVIWHQRVFHSDYNWGVDYEYLLQQAVARGVL
ncbi:MAG: hypothetical protein V3T17_07035 [Pseudomonadales bacterium]